MHGDSLPLWRPVLCRRPFSVKHLRRKRVERSRRMYSLKTCFLKKMLLLINVNVDSKALLCHLEKNSSFY